MVDDKYIKITSDSGTSVTIKDYGKGFKIPAETFKDATLIQFSTKGHCTAKSIKMTVGGVEVPPDSTLKVKCTLNPDKLPDITQEEIVQMLNDGWEVVPEELK